MKKKCVSCPYFLSQKGMDVFKGKLVELEFWQKKLVTDYNIKVQENEKLKKEWSQINRELERILCALKLIYRKQIVEAKQVATNGVQSSR